MNELWSSLGDLGKLLGDWCWLVGDQIFEGSAGNVMAEEVVLALILVGEDEFLGHWDGSVLDEVDEAFLGDVLAVENANVGRRGWSMLLEGLGGVSDITIIVIRESFVEGGGQMSIKWRNLWGGLWCWQSSDHHADGNVIVIIWVLGLVSIFLENRFESIITDDLSEGFEGDGVNDIAVESGRDFHGDGFDLIDWHAEGLGGELGLLCGNISLLLWWSNVHICQRLVIFIFLMVVLMVLVMMVLVVVLAGVQECVVVHLLLAVWHQVFDESDADVLAERVLNLRVGDILVAGGKHGVVHGVGKLLNLHVDGLSLVGLQSLDAAERD